MVKKILGVLATLAILALIVFVVLGAGSYTTMLPEQWLDLGKSDCAEVVVEAEPSVAETGAADTVVADSVAVENVEPLEMIEAE